jgi:hypothetical protein
MSEAQSQPPQCKDDFESLRQLIECLRPFDEAGKIHLLKSAITFLRLDSAFSAKQNSLISSTSQTVPLAVHQQAFSERIEMSPKQFLFEKQPNNDIERVACLAYYLTHYRNMPEFKTLDISQINTEAAQPKFSNASVPVDNARQRGFIVIASGGKKQLGALGEQFVHALPDREATKKVLEKMRVRRPRKKRNEGEASDKDEESQNE